MTQKIQKRLNDSKAARWGALIIVSFTMMMAYFFTDVMGPLEAPLTTKGKLVYFTDGTYLSADSLSKVSMQRIECEEEIVAGNTYNISYADKEGEVITAQRTVSSTINGLGWEGDDYGIFSGAYGYINVFLLMLFFGGIILDKMGVRFTGLMSTALMFIGAAIKWYAVSRGFEGEILGLPTQVTIACLGFAVYGMGAEIAG
ncbi:MAG: MFS transporter, partial [Bacteroidaceae bacterium]|nr:MFS transporter [Bacteroidaceae bacterium]